MQLPDSTYAKIHTSDISAMAKNTSRRFKQTHPNFRSSPTFSGPLMIYFGKTERYLLGEMRRVLVEE